MKIYLILLAGILGFTACSKNENEETSGSIMSCSKGEAHLSDDQGTKLNLTMQDWYLEKNDIGGGSVHLRITGSITGDSAKIRTFGDGVIYDAKIETDTDDAFNQEFTISFTATSLPEGNIMSNTLVFVYKAADTLQADLESCMLRY